jgi:hypothetical protein
MSNEMKTDNGHPQNGSGRKDSTLTNDLPKSGQQSQDALRHQEDALHHKNEKSAQQGGSDHNSGQQSQSGSRADDDAMKQAGSATIVSDPKKTRDATRNSGQQK